MTLFFRDLDFTKFINTDEQMLILPAPIPEKVNKQADSQCQKPEQSPQEGELFFLDHLSGSIRAVGQMESPFGIFGYFAIQNIDALLSCYCYV